MEKRTDETWLLINLFENPEYLFDLRFPFSKDSIKFFYELFYELNLGDTTSHYPVLLYKLIIYIHLQYLFFGYFRSKKCIPIHESGLLYWWLIYKNTDGWKQSKAKETRKRIKCCLHYCNSTTWYALICYPYMELYYIIYENQFKCNLLDRILSSRQS